MEQYISKASVFAQGNHQTLHRLIRLRKQAHAEKAVRVALRIQGIILSLEGYTPPQIAELLKVNRSTVPTWISQWNQFREEGLLEGHRCGHHKRLDDTQVQELLDIIESGPIAYGLHTGVWTSVIIASVIEEEFGIHFHPGHVRKLLKRFNCSVQRPGLRLIDADPKEVNRWTRYAYPNLKKKPKAKAHTSSLKMKRPSAKHRRSIEPGP